ncbi:FeoB small GTPase domain-containing protein [Methanoculleus bourgensis]|uniref:FeoB small GTPase domain-containing protein n=1 Tax=Methanoculleus bourgensis TaxID=83986 RepID=UPI0022ED7E98|nr:FeoB small GTPase domain-containing protein [Methanoculleus bourgensis]GLI47175.1 hypothetical protein MBOURGENBZM_19670 [Methanoculleus bourgensis]
MVGNPNVGKSALFNRLTGGDAVVSNYPGTTVDSTKGLLIESGQEYEVIDAPEPTNRNSATSSATSQDPAPHS